MKVRNRNWSLALSTNTSSELDSDHQSKNELGSPTLDKNNLIVRETKLDWPEMEAVLCTSKLDSAQSILVCILFMAISCLFFVYVERKKHVTDEI